VPKTAVVVTGIRRIDRRLHTLLPRIQKKVVRQGIRAGLKVIAAEVRATAPVDTGEMKAHVKVRAVKGRKRGSISLECRIGGSAKLKRTSPKTGKTVFYPAIVEYLKKKFMKRVFDSKGRQARQVMIDNIRSGIEREASRG
jgi:Bacteriophage HK97-gp10, putative tail-component